jgi:hypothetical protein
MNIVSQILVMVLEQLPEVVSSNYLKTPRWHNRIWDAVCPVSPAEYVDYFNRLFTLSCPEIKIAHIRVYKTWNIWSCGGMFKILPVVMEFLYKRGMQLHCRAENVCFSIFHQNRWALKYCSKQSFMHFQEMLDNLLHSCRICLNIIVLYDSKTVVNVVLLLTSCSFTQ